MAVEEGLVRKLWSLLGRGMNKKYQWSIICKPALGEHHALLGLLGWRIALLDLLRFLMDQ